MSHLTAALLGLAAVEGLMFLVWVASLLRRDVSLVDRFWGLAFVLLGWLWLQLPGSVGTARWILPVLVTIWGLRLSLHITWRNWGADEDPRYAAMRSKAPDRFPQRSLVTVFLLQGLLAWIIAAPLFAFARDASAPNPGIVGAGLMCWVFGMIFEAGGDWQLARHRANPATKGEVLDTGLWRYTRHPNYFGDALLWWGYGLMAASVGAWWSLLGPALMTFLLLKISGVALLERSLVETRPKYRDYVRRTSAFVPWPPKRA